MVYLAHIPDSEGRLTVAFIHYYLYRGWGCSWHLWHFYLVYLWHQFHCSRVC